ncbi:MAG TPA: proton-conducting transporter membrane subunit, partial [Phototrophicaceae bacterium]|nr:proton-conducting transporter membrane subunit [Phototrophicaceae bacterium]
SERKSGTRNAASTYSGILNSSSATNTTTRSVALMMALCMLSLTGIPLTGGFIGKWFVFRATLDAGLIPLAIIGVLTSVVSAFYYVRVIVNMYLRDGDAETPGATPAVNWAIYVAAAGTLIIGVFPFLVTNLSDLVTLAANIVR